MVLMGRVALETSSRNRQPTLVQAKASLGNKEVRILYHLNTSVNSNFIPTDDLYFLYL
jgi:hypothetical protein